NGELPLRRTVDILRDVLTALTHAHAAHIAHGDLKPENVLLTDGHTLVADTGIVEAVERSLPRGTPGLVTGALCATTYVAPERRAPQEPGQGERDSRHRRRDERVSGLEPSGERRRRNRRGPRDRNQVHEDETQRARIGRHRIAGTLVDRVEQHREVLHRHEPE